MSGPSSMPSPTEPCLLGLVLWFLGGFTAMAGLIAAGVFLVQRVKR